jgi:hypothetical protein
LSAEEWDTKICATAHLPLVDPPGGRAIITAQTTPVKINGVSEEPAATPDPAPERPSRYNRSFGGLLAAMVVTVLFVGAYVGFRALTRDQPELEPDVDYASCVAYLQEADVSVAYPQELPSGWRSNVIHFDRADPPQWRIGLLTDDDEFVGVVQQQADVDDLLAEFVDENPSQGDDASPENSLGVTSWQTWSDSGGDHAFSTQLESGPLAGQTLLVYGSAPVADQEALLRALTLDPVPGGVSAGDCDTDEFS